MNTPTYVISVSYEFEVVYRIKADNEVDARTIASHHCGVTLGKIHTTPDQVVNWIAPTHPTSRTIGAAIELPPLPTEAT